MSQRQHKATLAPVLNIRHACICNTHPDGLIWRDWRNPQDHIRCLLEFIDRLICSKDVLDGRAAGAP